jgi:hypothetical protein
MTYSTPTKLPTHRVLKQTIQVAHNDRESLRLDEVDYHVWNFIRLDIKQALGRSTIFADINVTQHHSGKWTGDIALSIWRRAPPNG